MKEKEATVDTSFPKKWEKKLAALGSAKELMDGMDDDELKKKIVQWQQAISNAEKDMDNDPKINSLKEELKQNSSVYKDTISESQVQMRYAVYLLESRGKL